MHRDHLLLIIEAKVRKIHRTLTPYSERQWVITQARKGNITEDDMQLQLTALQAQESAYQKELEEKQTLTAARQQAEALNIWANQYLSEIHAGIQALDLDVEQLAPHQREALALELESCRFADKFPGDERAQLGWALLQERRRVVRTLIDHVVIERIDGPEKRKITPVLTLDLPPEFSSLASGDQSLEFIHTMPYQLAVTAEEVGSA